MCALLARQAARKLCQHVVAPKRSRAPLRAFNSRVFLTPDNYGEKLVRGSKYLGTSAVYLNWEYEKGEEEFLEMCRAFAQAPAFENVAKVSLDAPHLPLDGRFVKVLGEGKPMLKELDIEAWTFHSPDQDMWAEFEQLHTFKLDLSDGRYFPGCFDDALSSLPATLQRRLQVTNRGPHYGALDCSLVPRGLERCWLEGLTLQNWAHLKGHVMETDCKRGARRGYSSSKH